jgi:glycosyltransferase involved in cell wall biosynthesis
MEKELLIDAVYINNSGGKILLDYLIESLEKQDFNVTYLLDERIRSNHPTINDNNHLVYLKASLKGRHAFYKANKHKFYKVLCFGNLPPSVRLKAIVYTYFHQKLFLEIPKQLPLKQKAVFFVKSVIFKFLKCNTDFWMVQTELMKQSLAKNGISSKKILILPFYPALPCDLEKNKQEKTFLFVSSGAEHKNHEILLRAFAVHFDQFKTGSLHLTVSNEFIELHQTIEKYKVKNYPVFNHGFVKRELLAKLYNSCTFVVYPSLAESFGLGLIEGLENDCKIIGANLPYTSAVCNPSLVFDPTDLKSITKAFQIACTEKTKSSEQLVFNEIHTIIELLK